MASVPVLQRLCGKFDSILLFFCLLESFEITASKHSDDMLLHNPSLLLPVLLRSQFTMCLTF